VISPVLPPELWAALDAKLEGVSRNDVAARAAQISKTYRRGGGSKVIATASDALAYALVRMPATYAALVASLSALGDIRPDFSPKALLDVGAGPGTASFAAAAAFSSLRSFTLLEANEQFSALASDLAQNARLHRMTCRRGDATTLLATSEPADLVIASYVVGEIGEAERRKLAAQLWAKTADTLVVVEPGTPVGYAHIIGLREQLIGAGAHVAAPCPHDGPCPLAKPDWCHFAQRLPRSRTHKQVKGVELPFEDEKFSYVVVSRRPVAGRHARVLAQPAIGKIEVSAKLCTADGLAMITVPHRDKKAYARARRWRWGDAVVEES
jgi:ribosomal protein RSM22 (predicted rRNA methylase)